MITFHVGLHKTGSSSIQSALTVLRHSRHTALALPGSRALKTDGSLHDWVKEQSLSRHLIVSSEGLFGEAIDGYPLMEHRLQQFSSIAGTRPLRVIIFLREPLDWLGSLYFQLLQEGGSSTPNEFWESIRSTRRLSALHIINTLKEQLPHEAVKVGVMNRRRDVVSDFFCLANLEKPQSLPIGSLRDNVSITAPQAVILRRMNSIPNTSDRERAAYRYFMQSMGSAGSFSTASPFSAETQHEILQSLGVDWGRLARELGQPSGYGDIDYEPSIVVDRSRRQSVQDSFSDPNVQNEILHLLVRAAHISQQGKKSLLRRAGLKAVRHPQDFFPAALRQIRDIL